MANNDVVTRAKDGQWVNEIEGSPELSQSYRGRDEAVQAGREFAAGHETRHIVEESEPTGAITDVAADQDEMPPSEFRES